MNVPANPPGMLTAEDVQEILHLLDTASLDELHLETARYTLTLRRAPDGAWTQQTQVTAAPNLVSSAPPVPEVTDVASPSDGASLEAAPAGGVSSPGGASSGGVSSGGASADEVSAAGLIEVRAPLPGTFYRAPKPGAAPFVEVGGQVEADTVVAIVETMKLMNSVFAGAAGTVAEICLANAEPTAQNGVLLRIRPTASASG